ncbi:MULTISPECIES: Holliday junction branch migration protein RuvA [Mesonia]|uniref:Holliday junction ATP-dependent DNA helicase RuvA n=1 Tax=Mesonia oceanica TaxID=2687242 RepID=A0AC61Y9C5_9FLAO|nr:MULTISPECIES: Holliday junction branch migration protein RuvA [Mesonia]MAN27424.1 Holliday junction branch migration protein RuvA [Mesonia sp.]MAQ40301.1 Holliday junction branch migration protein RuvA [Mesonia sp.]MBJ97212.1 Holliday junction branch migration protein RuvA [Flavobacteriaceae bacterium]VVV00733.1 Holliday junction ATP-dependent DNA helicase RuvA [Mesonia oceanica]|tara:strand:- start:27 stop:611 length:585 start_codon:yes stop_codon:yes gene_type:complete
MIAHLRGKLVEKNPTDIIVECNGVGYFLNISLHTFSQLPTEENIFIYTHLQVREDAHTLFGFMQKSEREVFRKLISVSGIGASTARTMLSSLTPSQVIEAIIHEDVTVIKGVKGIGAKTAQRVIIDLKDKLGEVSADVNEIVTSSRNTYKDEALSALETLGYTKKQSEKVVNRIIKNDAEASVETIIKLALKNL